MGMAERIKKRRKALGYTQTELGEKIGLQASAIAKYENGRVENIKKNIITDMAKALECSPSYLMGWDNDEDSTLQKRVAAFEDIERILSRDGYTLFCENYDDDYFMIKNSYGQTIIGFYDYELLPRYVFLKKKGTLTAEMLLLSSSKLYPEEQDYIQKYRELDHHGKEMVDFTLSKEWERSTAEKKQRSKTTSMMLKEGIDFVNAAHAIDGASEEDRQHDEDIMDADNF